MNNQKSAILILSFVLLGLMACDSEKTSEKTEVIENNVSTQPSATPPVNTIEVPPLSSIPETTPVQAAAIPPPTALSSGGAISNLNGPINTQKTSVGNIKLNPAHGQPGHDCAIPVGAPLKNTVAAAPAPTPKPAAAPAPSLVTETKPQINPVQAPVQTLDPKAKLNPAHGQPGHDCAVAVGAPLPVK